MNFVSYFYSDKIALAMYRAQPVTREELPRAYAAVLGLADTWWFCLLYSVTFGGFVGLASFLNLFFTDQYFPADVQAGAVYAGYFTTLCVVAGSFLRPVGGYLADRFGGLRMLRLLYAGVALALAGVVALVLGQDRLLGEEKELFAARALPAAVALLFVGMGLLGMGNGSVFQLVPQRFGPLPSLLRRWADHNPTPEWVASQSPLPNLDSRLSTLPIQRYDVTLVLDVHAGAASGSTITQVSTITWTNPAAATSAGKF